ncbi:hypothetical protein [Spirosoma endbachense]|nr:hypothetical protein [Spirosoma endbachense]
MARLEAKALELFIYPIKTLLKRGHQPLFNDVKVLQQMVSNPDEYR